MPTALDRQWLRHGLYCQASGFLDGHWWSCLCSELGSCAGSSCDGGRRFNKLWRGTFLIMHLLEKQAVHAALTYLLPYLALSKRPQQTAVGDTMQGLVVF